MEFIGIFAGSGPPCYSKSPDGLLPREWVGNDGAGVKWRGYSDGNGNITSFFPEQ